jgi:NAD-dependent oxidoreductase involved in siderophore biosynthesis
MGQSCAGKYEKKAKVCRDQAAKAQTELDRQFWLGIAAKWQRITDDVGFPKQQAQQPQPKENP